MIELDAGLLTAVLMVTVAGVIFGLAGFGFALTTVPVLLLVYDPTTVVVLIFVLSQFSCLMVILQAWRETEIGILLRMWPGSIVGLITGSYLLALAPENGIRVFAGLVVVGFSIIMLKGVKLPGANHPLAPPVAGLLSGTMGTSIGFSSPPPVMLLSAREYPRDTFRVNMSIYFLFVNTFGLITLLFRDMLTSDHAVVSGALLLPTIAGTLIGAYFSRFIPPHRFRHITLSLLLITGAMGIITAVNAVV